MFPEQPIRPVAALRALLQSGYCILPLTALMVLLSGFRSATFSPEHLYAGGPPIANTLLVTWIMGAFAGPLLLPWLPGHTLSIKSVMAGLLALLVFPATCFRLHLEPLDVLMALLVIPSATSLLMVILLTQARPGKVRRPVQTPESSTPIVIQLALVALAFGAWVMARFI